jgi:hypothetical protein
MPAKKYRVKLTAPERDYLEGLISKGKIAARKANHARILLHADEDNEAGYFKDEDIAAEMVQVGGLRDGRTGSQAFCRGRAGVGAQSDATQPASTQEAGWQNGGVSGGDRLFGGA